MPKAAWLAGEGYRSDDASAVHHAGCGCLELLSRRRAFGLGLAAAATVASRACLALDKGYEAMLMKCIDPRFTTNTWAYMCEPRLAEPVQPVQHRRRPDRRRARLPSPTGRRPVGQPENHLRSARSLAVVAITHRDCGAAVVAYGERIKTDRAFETQKHTRGAAPSGPRSSSAIPTSRSSSASWN